MDSLSQPALDAETRSGSRLYILAVAFLNLVGIGIVGPILPYITAHYVPPEQLAAASGLLFGSFSFFQFFAVPGLGALSDRFGRRPVLLISLAGSALGYLLFGLGGALWMLFLGRSIDGITGGNLSTIYAYAADISAPGERTRFFGRIGAASSLGFVVGPALGGLLARISLAAPMFFAAGITLLLVLIGIFVLPESLPADKRAQAIPLHRLNPFTQLGSVLAIRHLRLLMLGILIWIFAFSALPALMPVIVKDRLGWPPEAAGTIFLFIGVTGILTQEFVLPRLSRHFVDVRITIGGLVVMAAGFALSALSAELQSGALIIGASILTSLGNALTLTTITALVSQSAAPGEQGRVQGGSQAVQALARVAGPAWAGWVYQFGSGVPFWTGMVCVLAAAGAVILAIPGLAHRASQLSGVRVPEQASK